MGKYFSDPVEEGIRLVWRQFDKEEIHRGFHLLEEAAKEGDADAYCFLARCYMGKCYVWGDAGLPEDDDLAAKYIKESVLRGSAAGVLCAMRCGELTPGVRKNMPLSTTLARNIILEKAEAGETFCQYMIGNTYYWGDVIEIDELDLEKDYPTEESFNAFAYPKAIYWFERALQGGLAFASRNLCSIYEDGKGGIPGDEDRADECVRFAAALGSPEMMNSHGYRLTQKGKLEEGFHWYKASADAGDSSGCYHTGWGYENGKGAEESDDKAFPYYMRSAQMGYSSAYYKVGEFYYYGCAVEKDYAKAAFWYQKGVDENEFWCYPKLGICYRNGWGVQKDVDYAFRLLCMAENEIDEYSDNARGLIWNTLGNMYAYGDGVAEDIKRGVEYYQKAIAVGNENAESNIQDFKKNIFGKWKRR